MPSKPKAIFICKFLPYSEFSGGAIRTLNWINFLSKEFDLIILGYKPKINLRNPKKYNLPGRIISFELHDNLFNKIKSLIGLIVFETPISISKYKNIRIINELNTIKNREKIEFTFCSELSMTGNVETDYFLDEQNVEFELMQRRAEEKKGVARYIMRLEATALKRLELKAVRSALKTFFVSERDASIFENEINGLSVQVVKNTLPERIYSSLGNKQSTPLAIFTGILSWQPNKDGLSRFLKSVWPLVKASCPEAVFAIVGSGQTDLRENEKLGVKLYINASEEEKNKLLKKAWVAVAPIYSGSGTRIKILEYWDSSLPVISTELGVEGLAVSKGVISVVEDRDFAAEIVRVIGNKNLTDKMGKINKKIFDNNYSYRNIYENSLYNTFRS